MKKTDESIIIMQSYLCTVSNIFLILYVTASLNKNEGIWSYRIIMNFIFCSLIYKIRGRKTNGANSVTNAVYLNM